MSTRYTPKDIHPSVFKQVLKVTGSYSSGNTSDPKIVAAGGQHSRVWMAEYWKGFVLWFAFLIVVIVGTVSARDHLGKPGAVFILMTGILSWILLGYWGLQRNRGVLTWEEIEAVRPALELDDHQSLYLDCFRYVEESRILDPAQKKSWREALYRALDQAVTLQNLSQEMKDSAGGKDHSESLAEIDRLDRLADQSSDPVAKKAYLESAHLARERMSKWDGMASQAERTEAHLELTRQTLLKTRDTLKGLSLDQQRTVHVDLEPLRQNLSKMQSEAYEIQRAIEELKEL